MSRATVAALSLLLAAGPPACALADVVDQSAPTGCLTYEMATEAATRALESDPDGRLMLFAGPDAEALLKAINDQPPQTDFRADQKWMDYRLHCDRLFFATIAEVPCEIFPADAGLIVADAFGASILCEAPEHRLPAATRKSIMLRFAHAAALRLQALADPQGPYAGEF